VADSWSEVGSSGIDLQSQVREAVSASIRSHLVSDVPVCVFLSAGIDSAVVAALAAETATPVAAVTVGFDEFVGRAEDEVPMAAVIAKYYGLEHSVRRVSSAEFEEDLPRVLDAMDQPSIDGVNTWFASKAAAERGFKVALSGVGGDELFCGYSSFQRVPRAVRAMRAIGLIPGARGLLAASCRRLARNPRRAKLAALPAFSDSIERMYFLSRALFLPEELVGLMGVDAATDGLQRLGSLGAERSQASDEGPATLSRLESTHYLRNQLLRDADWSSMAHSLELRTPLVDACVLRSLAPWARQFTGGRGKRMLAGAPKKALPKVIAQRRKTGFSLPMTQWLATRTPTGREPRHGDSRTSDIPWARRWAATVLDAAMGCG
jgi:asparagine synthase (glutamine-hydrolysing)